MSEEENVVAAEPTMEVEPTLFDQVKQMEADEVEDDNSAVMMELRLGSLEVALAAAQARMAEMAERLQGVESAAPVAVNEKLEALVAKHDEKLKLLIPMD